VCCDGSRPFLLAGIPRGRFQVRPLKPQRPWYCGPSRGRVDRNTCHDKPCARRSNLATLA
jgi:hypothetical protein